jgi:carboxypeptidase Taq
MSESISALKERLYDINALHSAISVMDWDQQTYMPEGGAEARAHHVGILSRMGHEMASSDAMGRLIEDASKDAETFEDKALVRVTKRQYDQATKLPSSLVEAKTRLAMEAHNIWVKARKENDFSQFEPSLAQLLDYTRQEAEHYGYTNHIYDALIDLYEEGATKADCDRMFDGIRQPLVELVQDLKSAPRQPDDSFLYGEWDIPAQKQFTESIVKAIGFDFARGRQDTAPHPFCTNFSVGDVRLTTRYLPYLGSAIFGSLHEAGHGMYEQGSPVSWDRLPIAGGVSLGIHESQSRTWENLVGRSRAFWSVFYPQLQASFPALADKSLDDFLFAVNKVEPSFIRVEADEVTYNLHIMVRFELECQMLTGELSTKDLPEAWNAKYQEYLGITPPNDAQGCLQDVHWSMGSMGYFPTYSMGNLLSSQFWAAMKADVGDQDALMAKGEFAPILGWLQEKIYSKGSTIPPQELVMQVTGKPMGPEDYMAALTAKYRSLYGLA